jgi:hypothetical protein
MATNLPPSDISDSAAGTKKYFETYGEQQLEFNAVDVDATIAFFSSKGFDNDAALSVSAVLLKQAKTDNIPVFELLDRLKEFTGLQLNTLIAEILNNDRTPSSTLGFKQILPPENKVRNIAV